MIEIPLYSLLFVYILFLAIFVVFILIDLYHIIMTASLSMTSFFMTFFVFVTSFLIIYATWYFLQNVDWRQILITIPPLGDLIGISF